jgi:hypothetical protein
MVTPFNRNDGVSKCGRLCDVGSQSSGSFVKILASNDPDQNSRQDRRMPVYPILAQIHVVRMP